MTEEVLVKIVEREINAPKFREPELNLSIMEGVASEHFREAMKRGIVGGLYASLATAGAAAIVYGTQGHPEYIANGFLAFFIGIHCGGVESILDAIEGFKYSRKINESIKEAIRKGSVIIEVPETEYKII